MNISTLINLIEQWQNDPITDTIFTLVFAKEDLQVMAYDCKARKGFKINSEHELDHWYREIYKKSF